jgi:hypothetical protein
LLAQADFGEALLGAERGGEVEQGRHGA